MLLKEIQSIWNDKKFTLSIIVMFFMPVLYAGMLLWAFWDPYGHLSNLPVAVVNMDDGAVFEGEELALGDELVEKLADNDTFKVIEATSDEAEKMLKDRDVYIVIEVPKDFSQNATTLLDANPIQLELIYRADESTNFLSSTIGENAIDKIKAEVSKQISITYADQLFTAITKLSDGFTEAADGAVKINDGVVDLQNGTVELKDYLYMLANSSITLNDGTRQLVDGISKASFGSKELTSGLQTLNEKAPQLTKGATDIANGITNIQNGISSYTVAVDSVKANQFTLTQGQVKLNEGLSKYVNGVSSVQSGSESLQQGTTALAAQVQALTEQLTASMQGASEEEIQALQASLQALNTTVQQIAGGANALATGTTQLQSGGYELLKASAQLTDGQSTLQAGLNHLAGNNAKLTEGINQLASGTNQFVSSITQYTNGVAQAASGANSLATGLQTLNNGAVQIVNGTKQLVTSSKDLADGASSLVEGTKDIQDGTSDLVMSLQSAGEDSKMNASNANNEMVADPVKVNKEVKAEVNNYGSGFAPYFMSLGLFVGALILTNVYPFVEPAIRPTGIRNWFASKSFVPVIVGIFQVAILSFVVLKWLGLHVEHIGLFLLITLVTSFAFLAIVQVLTVVAGDVGRFLSLVFLILQLASSAGTFPIELVPDALQKVHPYMPMTYSVEAYRSIITTTNMDIIMHSLWVLGLIGVCCVFVSLLFFALLYKKRYSKASEVTQ